MLVHHHNYRYSHIQCPTCLWVYLTTIFVMHYKSPLSFTVNAGVALTMSVFFGEAAEDKKYAVKKMIHCFFFFFFFIIDVLRL